MDSLPKYYTLLYNAVTDALREMEKQNFGMAVELLQKGQSDAEDAYLNLCEEEN